MQSAPIALPELVRRVQLDLLRKGVKITKKDISFIAQLGQRLRLRSGTTPSPASLAHACRYFVLKKCRHEAGRLSFRQREILQTWMTAK